MVNAASTLPLRKEMAKLYPWVTYLKRPRDCQGYTTKASRTRGKYTCKHKAHWKFKFSKRADLFNTDRGTAYFCWVHLLTRGLYGDMGEYNRTVTYGKRHEDKFKPIMDKIKAICGDEEDD